MFTAENLKKANKDLASIPFKGKEYVMVNERIRAFREMCPSGSITTDIISMENGVVTMKATVCDEDGKIIGTGIAQEKETSSYINKTSYVENCETSAVGRALGMCGIGSYDAVSTAEELANAVTNQGKKNREPDYSKELASDRERKVFFQTCEKLGVDSTQIMKQAGWTEGKMTVEQHGKAMIILRDIENEKR